MARLQHPDHLSCAYRRAAAGGRGHRFVGGAKAPGVLDDDDRLAADRPGERDAAGAGGPHVGPGGEGEVDEGTAHQLRERRSDPARALGIEMGILAMGSFGAREMGYSSM